jgi:hypothetical protein
MEPWLSDIEFETHGPVMRLLKGALFSPMANYLPAAWLKGALRFGKSQMAAANWEDPGGWRSMVLSYDARPTQVADKILIATGTMAMALRNRKRLAARVMARLIDDSPGEPVHVLCLGAGPGHVITDAMVQATRPSVATLVDLNGDAFEYGRRLARRKGVADRVRFIEGDVRQVRRMLAHPPDLVTMLGICEYLSDEQIADISRAVAEVMPPGASVVFNSLSQAHRTDRFFRRVFGLHMNHRSPEQLQRLIAAARLGDFVSLPEPLGVYHVVVGRRMEGR